LNTEEISWQNARANFHNRRLQAEPIWISNACREAVAAIASSASVQPGGEDSGSDRQICTVLSHVSSILARHAVYQGLHRQIQLVGEGIRTNLGPGSQGQLRLGTCAGEA